MSREKSAIAFKEAQKFMPGGVNSPIRAFQSIDKNPPFIRKGKGAYITDIDENRYIDFCLSWGVFIQGHAHPHILEKVNEAVLNGTSFGAPTLGETRLAERIVKHVPSLDRVRLVNSGTEAVMSALRLARAYTGKSLVLKFDGCYHGHVDSMLVKAGSGLSENTNSSSSGVLSTIIGQTISIPFNDVETLRRVFENCENKIAAVITEPIPANMGVIPPSNHFLEILQGLCQQYNSLLIFDEVITGFRTGLSGAQGELDIKPDLTCLGKIIGGGFPIGAYGGRADIMQLVAPEGEMYQAGTLSGNPVAVAAGNATMDLLEEDDFYAKLAKKSAYFAKEVKSFAPNHGIRINQFNSMFSIFFTNKQVRNFRDASETSIPKFRKFYLDLLEQGIYLSPSPFETNFISAAHTDQELDKTLDILKGTLKRNSI